MLEEYPKSDASKKSTAINEAMIYIQEVTTSIRNIRAEANISPAKNVTALIKTTDEEELRIIEENSTFIMKLAKLDSLMASKEIEKPELSGFRVT